MPLREIESAPVRQHMFGNPFKINKNMIMDEVVMDEVSLVPNGSATGASASNQPAKGVKRPATPDSPGGPMASKRLRKGKEHLSRKHFTRLSNLINVSSGLQIEIQLFLGLSNNSPPHKIC